MSDKRNAKRAVVRRVGVRVTDGKIGGRIIALSGEDVAIEWDDGRIEQRKWDSMQHFTALKV